MAIAGRTGAIRAFDVDRRLVRNEFEVEFPAFQVDFGYLHADGVAQAEDLIAAATGERHGFVVVVKQFPIGEAFEGE